MDVSHHDANGTSPSCPGGDVEAAIRAAAQDAVRQHKRLGLPMVDYQDGAVVWIPADQLPGDPPPAN
jgi:hypothetical protein